MPTDKQRKARRDPKRRRDPTRRGDPERWRWRVKGPLLVDTEPQCLTVRGATASLFEVLDRDRAPPGIELSPSTKLVTRGCLYDAAGRKLSLSQRPGGMGGDTVMAIDPERLDLGDTGGVPPARSGRALYLGCFMHHYGHFVTEFLSRLWLAEATANFDHLVAHPFIFDAGRGRPRRVYTYVAGLLGVPLGRLEVLRAPARFEEIVVPEQLWTMNRTANVRLRPLYERIRGHHAGGASSGRLFLSRGTYPGSRLANAPEIEEVFSCFGFRVIFPEEHDIARQLDLYANCEILAGPSGSGLHNCLFTRPGTPVIEVGDARTRNQPIRMQSIAIELAGVRHHFLRYEGGQDCRTDPARVAQQLSEILGERPRPGGVLVRRLARLVEYVRRPDLLIRRRRRVPPR